ncbi:putative Pleckstrin like-type, Oxysterol-binding protein, Pleckstrin like domain protein [Trachipleistophora hominis]|uniref:Putative Pleckstrin like-type, Oxysterol-binding protein, Pleckstrin like domain protein n=1 Tax=Trachipleistophora hominis TaxID=72359 RepID=L7JS09_TRAHO|nr:putative Pleckstrin like-type, Oxysterol-binding protein, Pleckstrin like domain protein [Trachipleistophora hominis]
MDHVVIALRILNDDISFMMKLVKEKYVSPIFGTVGEHLVYLRRIDLLKSLCASLEDEKVTEEENMNAYLLKRESDDCIVEKNSAINEFIASFLPLSKKLNYPEITLYFDSSSIRSPVRAGLLQKYTNIINRYQTRYVTLYDDFFSYYKIREGKKFLRKKLSLNTIRGIKLSRRRLIISTYDDKIVFTSTLQDLMEWYKVIDDLIKRMNDREFYVNNYVFKLLYYLCEKEARKEMLKIDHLSLYIKDKGVQAVASESNAAQPPVTVPQVYEAAKTNEVQVSSPSESPQLEEFESATENNSSETFYDFEENGELTNVAHLVDSLVKSAKRLAPALLPVSLLEPQSTLQRMAEGALLFKNIRRNDSLSEQHAVVLVAVYIVGLMNLQLDRKFAFESLAGETFFAEHENTKIYCEKTLRASIVHAVDDLFTLTAVIDLAYDKRNKKIVVYNKSKCTLKISDKTINFGLPNVRIRRKLEFCGECMVESEGEQAKLLVRDNNVTFSYRNGDKRWQIVGPVTNITVFCNERITANFSSNDFKKMKIEDYEDVHEYMPSDSRGRADIQALQEGRVQDVNVHRQKMKDQTKLKGSPEMKYFDLIDKKYVLKKGDGGRKDDDEREDDDDDGGRKDDDGKMPK